MNKKVKMQQREYTGADGTTKYTQWRINIPDGIIQKTGWDNQDQITISVESPSTKKNRNDKKKIIVLKNTE
ncbi:MAG: hypothetical protein ACR2LL_12500 [Nitrosopumilus sp.]